MNEVIIPFSNKDSESYIGLTDIKRGKLPHKITKYFILLIIALNFSNLSAQKLIKKYVVVNTIPIVTIDPDSTNFSDLQAIGKAIGKARIVMLGEQDHGDAPTFLAKTRIIKYLHEEKGFNVLAFEGDFFGLNYGWSHLNKNKKIIDSFLLSNVVGVWSNCQACSQLLFHYIPNSFYRGDPLQVSGFDCQMFLPYSSKYLFTKLDSVLESLKIPITQSREYKGKIFPTIEYWYKNIKNDSLFGRGIHYLTTIKSQMIDKLPEDNFWVMVVKNLINENIEFKYYNEGKREYYNAINTRDSQMAENLKWLIKAKYPKQKIIVWAHNVHISKYNGHYPQSFLNQMKTMGGIFTSDSLLKDETYILGFTSYEGTAGRIMSKEYQLPTPQKNSLENWISHNYDYAFINFIPFRKKHPNDKKSFYMAGSIWGNQHHTISKAQWDKIFDGVFYIKKMYPCKLMKR